MTDMPVEFGMFSEYMRLLVNRFFKILPIKESEEPTLTAYMQSLQMELIGCKTLVSFVRDDPAFLSLISILQYLIDHPECSTLVVKREIFHAISICNKLKSKYAVREDTGDGE